MRSHSDCIMAWMTEPRERVLAADARALTAAEVVALDAEKRASRAPKLDTSSEELLRCAQHAASQPTLPQWAVDHIAFLTGSSRLSDCFVPHHGRGIFKNIGAVNRSFSLSDDMRKLDHDLAMEREIREAHDRWAQERALAQADLKAKLSA